ncbi:unnamed protein product [Pleuronectes platessa]|uniref:SLC12A transporter C-terminal domain-containing protein n=1 Tax=Pleuronectes platessa TaxID=8262 RepID=A0A9N7YG69_PLEPL|nr:unnamed protein product [Pleuronectes platessa]
MISATIAVNLGSSVQACSYNIALNQCVGLNQAGPSPAVTQEAVSERHVTWLNRRKGKSFYRGVVAADLRSGVNMLLKGAALVRIKPNVLLMGFKKDWRCDSPQAAHHYIGILHDVFDLHSSVCLLRVKEGLDFSHPTQSHDENPQPSSMCQIKQGKKTIDIYWLSDDGGLTLLLPYLLTRRKRWAGCKVRVFVGGDTDQKEEQKEEWTLLQGAGTDQEVRSWLRCFLTSTSLLSLGMWINLRTQ